MRYLVLFVLAFGLSACGGESGPDESKTEYTVLESQAITLHVEDGLSLPQIGTFSTMYREVATCTGIPAYHIHLYLVRRNLDEERFSGFGMQVDEVNDRLLIEGLTPGEESERQDLMYATRHGLIHYQIFKYPYLNHHLIGHNHDYFVSCMEFMRIF